MGCFHFSVQCYPFLEIYVGYVLPAVYKQGKRDFCLEICRGMNGMFKHEDGQKETKHRAQESHIPMPFLLLLTIYLSYISTHITAVPFQGSILLDHSMKVTYLEQFIDDRF
ncbi:unnamed protein product [Linum trigynum]|uniref:Uncharacterized protein n=1 Tax=Linum trigynum TaxID=586398 RepID=A0AAV2DK59_9ROSI